MKHLNLSLIFILFITSIGYSQKIVKSQVKEAVIFASQAQLTRVQTVKLEKGMNKIKFVEMENSLDGNSLQVSSSSNEVTIISSNVLSENTDKSTLSREVVALQDSVAVWTRKEQLSAKKVQNLDAEKNAILYNKSANGANSGFNLDNMADLAEYYRNNLNNLDEKIYDQNLFTQQAREKKNYFNSELSKIGFKARNNVLNLEIISERAQAVAIKLVYVVNDIGWTPFYEIKGNDNSEKLAAICKAQIYQNSTIDWNNVALTLSTSKPLNNGVLPTVHPWVLRFQNDVTTFDKARNQSKTYNGAVSNASYELSPSYSNSLTSYTTATDNMVSREFNISLPYSISGANGKAVVELEKFDLPANYLYYAAPKYSCDVFLIAQVTDWEQYNLLPGTANLFMEGNFVGTTMINPNTVSDTMNLVLGKDESIVVKREKIKDLSKRAVLGNSKKVDMGIQITVKNTKSKEIEIILEDQVPVSGDASIEIEYKDISGAKKEEGTGKLTWQYELKPGKTEIHKIRYEVKHPKNKKVANF